MAWLGEDFHCTADKACGGSRNWVFVGSRFGRVRGEERIGRGLRGSPLRPVLAAGGEEGVVVYE